MQLIQLSREIYTSIFRRKGLWSVFNCPYTIDSATTLLKK